MCACSQHLVEHVAKVGELAGDVGELLVDCRAPLLHTVQQVQGRDAVGVGFVYPLHMVIDPAGCLADLLDLLPDGLGENRVLGAACACSPGHGVYRLLEVGHELSRQQAAPGRRTGVGLGARRCKVRASDNLGGRLWGGVRWPRWGLLGASRGGSLGFSGRVPSVGRSPLELG
jgi:hypothetical protein